MRKRLIYGYSVLEIAYWCFFASFVGFISAYLLHRGISNTLLSLLIAANMLCAFLGSFVWGGLCDRFRTNRKIFIIGLAVSGLLMYGIYFWGGITPLVALAYPLLGFVAQPLASNMDSWVLASCQHDQSIYGRIRSTPSFFYAFVAAILGKLIVSFGYYVTLIGGTFFLVLGLVTAWLLPDSPRVSQEPKEKVTGKEIGLLFKNRPYCSLIVILFLIGLASAPHNSLKIVMLESVGGNVSHIGIDSFIGAMTQVPFIAMAGMTQKLPLRLRYLMMSVLPLCMLLLTFFAVSPAMIFVGTCLSNVSYGILLPTMREVTETHIESGLRNLGHNVSEAIYTSFSGMISLIYAGAVVDRWGVHTMLAICIGIMLIPVLMSLFQSNKDN